MMRLAAFWSVVIAILLITVTGWYLTRGDGTFTRLTTLRGLYAVPDVGGYDVVCFVNRDGGAMSCLPRKEVQK